MDSRNSFCERACADIKDRSKYVPRAFHLCGSEADWKAIQFSYSLCVFKAFTDQPLNQTNKTPEAETFTPHSNKYNTFPAIRPNRLYQHISCKVSNENLANSPY